MTATDVSQPPGPTRPEPLPKLVTQLWELTFAYLKQETVGPLGGLGRFLAFGALGAFLTAVGTSVLLVAVLRVLQTETGTTFRGNLTALPYVIAAGTGVAVAAAAGLSVVSGRFAEEVGERAAVTGTAVDGRVAPADIEAKLRQIRQELDRTTQAAKPAVLAVAGAAMVAVVTLAYVLGRRRGRAGRTVVEVRRV